MKAAPETFDSRSLVFSCNSANDMDAFEPLFEGNIEDDVVFSSFGCSSSSSDSSSDSFVKAGSSLNSLVSSWNVASLDSEGYSITRTSSAPHETEAGLVHPFSGTLFRGRPSTSNRLTIHTIPEDDYCGSAVGICCFQDDFEETSSCSSSPVPFLVDQTIGVKKKQQGSHRSVSSHAGEVAKPLSARRDTRRFQTGEQRAARLKKDAERHQAYYLTETDERRNARRAKDAERHRLRYERAKQARLKLLLMFLIS
jgi:CCR4-NOT transcriptional regulation complex NOT5 subunit